MFELKSPFGKFFSTMKSWGLEAYNLFYGRYRAFVVDNDDPEKMGRIKVRIPSLGHSTSDWLWAYPKFPTPCGKVDGKSYGMYVPPPAKDTTVWVEFEVGRAKHPIYTGGWFGKDELPDKIADVAPAAWMFWSLAQNYLSFIDKEDEEEVELAWMGKHKITMDKDHILIRTENGTQLELKADGTFDIKDEKQNEIKSDSNKLEVISGQASVVLENGQATVKAATFTWAPGGSTASAKASVRGEDLVKVLNQLVTQVANLKVAVTGGVGVTDPSSAAQLLLLVPKLQKALVPTFKT